MKPRGQLYVQHVLVCFEGPRPSPHYCSHLRSDEVHLDAPAGGPGEIGSEVESCWAFSDAMQIECGKQGPREVGS